MNKRFIQSERQQKLRRSLLLFFSLLLSWSKLQATNLYSLDIDIRGINASLYDSNGVLWIATERGLTAKADSLTYKFESKITDQNSPIDSNITGLSLGLNGDVIALSESGLSIFQEKQFNFKQIHLDSEPVTIIVDTVDQTYWVPTQRSGIYILDKHGGIVRQLKPDPLNPLTLSSLRFYGAQKNDFDFDDKQFVYIATDNGLNIYNRENRTIQRLLDRTDRGALLSNNIKSMYRIDEQTLLIATDRGVNIFDTNKQIFSKKYFLAESSIESLSKVKGNFFFAIIDGQSQFLIIDPSAKQVIPMVDKRLDQLASTASELTFIVNGLKSLVKSGHDLFEIDEDINVSKVVSSPDVIIDVIEMESGYLLSTKDNLYHVRTEEQSVRQEFEKDILYFRAVKGLHTVAIYEDKIDIVKSSLSTKTSVNVSNAISLDSNALIVSSDTLITIINNGLLSIFSINENIFLLKEIDIFDSKVTYIDNLKSIDNSIYASTGNGILKFTYPDAVTPNFKDQIIDSREYFEYNSLLNNKIPRVFFDIAKVGDRYWISSPDLGLTVHNPNLNELVYDFSYKAGDRSTLASGSPRRILISSSNSTERIFIGSRGQGLFSYSLKEESFIQYDTDDGLLSNNILDLMMDSNETLWIQSSDGLNTLTGQTIKTILTPSDGLNITIPHKSFIHQFKDRIFLTGRDVSQSFDPDQITKKNAQSRIHITRIQGLDGANNSVNYAIPSDGKLNLNHKTTSLMLDAFVDRSHKSNLVRFFYTFANSDETIPNGRANTIQISEIPYYQSSLSIFGIDENGQKTSNTIDIKLNRQPPEWMRYEMIFFYMVLILGALVIMVKRREDYQLKAAESRRHEAELDEARRLQKSLLPKEIPSNQELDISTFLRPATEVGGDYYDFYETKDGLYAVCGDATGHGVISGIMVSVTKAGLLGITFTSPSEILRKLNKIVKEVNFGRVRMSLTITKITSEKLTVSSAAMPPLYLFRSDTGKVEEMLVPNLPLGGLESENYESFDAAFNKGDVLVMVSDGLAELPNKKGELLEYERINFCILENAKKRAEQIKNALVELADQWSHGLSNPDDITVLVIKKSA